MAPPIAKFNTLERERIFKNPSDKSFQTPALQEMVAPHIEAFNALTEFGVGKKTGLLDLALQDIGSKVVFDQRGSGLGNKLSCTCFERIHRYYRQTLTPKPTN
jgi:DNA-directed RNA polymerase I subunit RPA2